MKSSIENEIKTKGYVFYEVHGSSMLPLIRQDKDLTIIKKIASKLHKYDVVLYKRGQKLILHRIVKIKSGKYIIAGDNCANKEYDITNENIIGILSSIERNAKTKKNPKSLSVESTKQKLYARTWCALFPIRSAYLKSRHAFVQTKLGQTIKRKIRHT